MTKQELIEELKNAIEWTDWEDRKHALDKILKLDFEIASAVDEPEYNRGDRVLVKDPCNYVKAIYIDHDDDCYYLILDGSREVTMWVDIKPDPSQKTLGFVEHDGGGNRPDGVGGGLGFFTVLKDGHLFGTRDIFHWKDVKYYAIKPEWMK